MAIGKLKRHEPKWYDYLIGVLLGAFFCLLITWVSLYHAIHTFWSFGPRKVKKMNPIRFIGWIVIFAFLFLAFERYAKGEGMDELLPHFAQPHWYDIECCNRRDCRKVSDLAGTGESEVIEVQGGWLWISSKSGKEHFFPHGSDKIKPSRDGDFHGCESPTMHLTFCLYIPMLF